MKKFYEEPSIEVIKFTFQEILAESKPYDPEEDIENGGSGEVGGEDDPYA